MSDRRRGDRRRDELRRRVASLPRERRELLERRLRRRAGTAGRDLPATGGAAAGEAGGDAHDVIIVGGGLAGATLALQIVRERPGTDVVVLDREAGPLPEAAHKVGESTVELGAFYLREVLGLGGHLEEHQLPKAGLRYFFDGRGNRDVAERVEFGATFLPPVPSHQLDRGRIENHLRERLTAHGVRFLDGARVRRLEPGADRHRVTFDAGGVETTLRGRWLVDASGRARLLQRRLRLGRTESHRAHAVWFRLDAAIDPDGWSEDPRWRAAVPPGLRRLSTNHLMGRGYWVWLIPLASGGTSVGIVADETLHPLGEMNTFDRALAWLARHEPQCAAAVEARRNALRDFRGLRRYTYGCERVFAGERWCLVGEAGVFSDPLYSPGTDFIGLANTLVADLVVRDLEGEAIRERAEAYDRFYLNTFESLMVHYRDLYPVMGNAQVMTAKVVWDSVVYWGFLILVFFNRRLCDLELMAAVREELQRVNHLNARMQELFRLWDRRDRAPRRPVFIDIMDLGFLRELHWNLDRPSEPPELARRIGDNRRLLEAVAVELVRLAAGALDLAPPGEGFDPYTASLEPGSRESAGRAAPGARDGGAVFEGAELCARVRKDLEEIRLDPLAPAPDRARAHRKGSRRTG
ncbi:MAG: tryptophan 7-halogenase [Acidobacteriota bacterium]